MLTRNACRFFREINKQGLYFVYTRLKDFSSHTWTRRGSAGVQTLKVCKRNDSLSDNAQTRKISDKPSSSVTNIRTEVRPLAVPLCLMK